MRGNRFLRVLKIVVIVAVAITVFSFVTMHLWNWLMPAVFGLRTITWAQALGLLVLGKILFGGFHRHGGGCRGRGWKRRHGGAMGEDESRRARTVARGNARTMGLRVRSGIAHLHRKQTLAKEYEERLNAVTVANAEPIASGVDPEEEQKGMMDYEKLAEMPLESLLYYVLVGEGRKKNEASCGMKVRSVVKFSDFAARAGSVIWR